MSNLSFINFQELRNIIGQNHIRKQNFNHKWNDDEQQRFIRFNKANKNALKDKEYFQYMHQYIKTKSPSQCKRYFLYLIQQKLKRKMNQINDQVEMLYCFKQLPPDLMIVQTKSSLKIKKNPEYKEEQLSDEQESQQLIDKIKLKNSDFF